MHHATSLKVLGPSKPITHSSVTAEVQWPEQPRRGGVSSSATLADMSGKPLVVRFVMEEAKLYTFQFV
jgi:hypothetical protein